MNWLKPLLIAYFFLAGVTWVESAEEIGGSVLGRLSVADLLMVPLIPLACLVAGRVRVTGVAWAGMALVLAFMPGMLLTDPTFPKLLELAVHVFLIAGYIALCGYLTELPADERIAMLRWFVRMGGALALVGLWDLLAPLAGLPGIAPSLGLYEGFAAQGGEITGAVTGTFRNTGQAGAYFGVVLACAVALCAASDDWKKLEAFCLVAVLAIAIVLTVKRAAVAGAAVGVVLLSFRSGMRGIAKGLIAATAIVAFLLPLVGWLDQQSQAFSGRVQWKVVSLLEADGVHSRFLEGNVQQTARAVVDSPVFGKGAWGAWIEGHEIHSTPLRVLADGGLLAAVAYGMFLVCLWRSCCYVQSDDPLAQRFAWVLAPMLIGLVVSWTYTYHLRKREFWIMAALAAAIAAPVRAEDRDSCDPLPLEGLHA